jgi:ABC-2 type transport system permease protein
VRPLWAVFRARFRLLLQYRTAAFAGLVTQVCFGLVLTGVMTAFYGGPAADRAPLTLTEVVTYIWLGQALLGLLPWRMDAEIRAMVATGGLAYELLRPVDLLGWWTARAVALRTAPVLLRAVPLLILAGAFFGLRPPEDAGALALWTAGLAGAVALSAAFTVLMSISLLWTLSGEGMQYAMPGLASLLSGHLLPLPLFPEWAKPIVEALPFRGLMDTPHRLWLGALEGEAAWRAIAHQWVWVVALLVLARVALTRGLRRVVIQGG